MQIRTDGVMTFDDIFDLNYNFLSEMSMSVNSNGVIYYKDDDTGETTILKSDGKDIIASIDPNNIHYAGPITVQFDILNDIVLVQHILGFYLQVCQNKGMPFISYFPEEQTKTFKVKRNLEIDIKYTAETIKLSASNSITSHYYHNKCLKYIDLIFMLEGDIVDLSNFDQIDLEKEALAQKRG